MSFKSPPSIGKTTVHLIVKLSIYKGEIWYKLNIYEVSAVIHRPMQVIKSR